MTPDQCSRPPASGPGGRGAQLFGSWPVARYPRAVERPRRPGRPALRPV